MDKHMRDYLAACAKRRARITRLRKAGASASDIARMLKISRQRVGAVLKREGS